MSLVSTIEAIPGEIKHLFINTIGNCKHIFKNGDSADFLGGRYLTSDPTEIAELQAEIKAGHPYIKTKPDELTVDTTYQDPLEAVKNKAVADYLAAQAAAMNKEKDVGSTDQSGVISGIGNTTTVAEAMSGSTSIDGVSTAAPATISDTTASAAGTAKLAALKAAHPAAPTA